jgi:DNA-binding LytR/AlgR family response regulator
MWILVIVAISGKVSALTVGTLQSCEEQFLVDSAIIDLDKIKEAYCKNGNDVHYFIKNGKTLP